jgi:hypothetical protein
VVKDRPWNDGLDLAWVERLPLVRPVRLIASDRYDPHFRERDASGTDRRAEAAFDAFAAGLVNALGAKVVVPDSGSVESRAPDEGALFVRAQILRAEPWCSARKIGATNWW